MMLPRLREFGGDLLEVRCCCQPKKLLGWLPVPRHIPDVRAGTVVTFTVRDEWLEVDGGRIEWHVLDDRGLSVIRHPAERVQLPIATVVDGESRWLAFKSEETPIEQLRRIPGFVESLGH